VATGAVIVLRPARTLRWATALVIVVHLLNATVHLAHGFAPTKPEWWLLAFDVDTEANVPTWFSSGLLLTAALAAGLMASRARDRSARERRGFSLVAVLLGLVSADETAALHEKLAAALFPWMAERGLSRLWVWAIGAVVVAGLAGVLLPFLRALPSRLRSGLVLSAVVFVTGALGFEVIGQRYAATHGWFDPIYVGLAAIEELLEMCGPLLFLHAVGKELANADGTVNLHVGSDAAT
jgi:hypothetical protein